MKIDFGRNVLIIGDRSCEVRTRAARCVFIRSAYRFGGDERLHIELCSPSCSSAVVFL